MTKSLLPELMIPTVGNKKWLADNATAIRNLFPETWTHVANINIIQLMFRLKLLGVEYRSDQDFATALAQFEINGLIKRDGHTLRRAA